MASVSQQEVLAAVLKFLQVEQFQDVCFVCSDGRAVCSNRAYLAARCEYFERLLYGGLCEAGRTEIRLQASSEALHHVLHHLHTGSFDSVEREACWDIIMETCALAQQYMLPSMLEHIGSRVMTDLQPQNLGLALSFALKHDLQPVIQNIWLTGGRLLQHPINFDSSFSAEAICFCLQHTAWLTAQQGPGSRCSTAAERLSSASSMMSLDGRDNGSGTSNGRQPCVVSCSHAAHSTSSSAVMEGAAFEAVLEWMQREVASCEQCQHSRHVPAEPAGQSTANSSTAVSYSVAKPQELSSAFKPKDDISAGSALSAFHPGGWPAPGRQSPFGAVQPSSSIVHPAPASSAAGTEALAVGEGSDSDNDSILSRSTDCTSSSARTARAAEVGSAVASPVKPSPVTAQVPPAQLMGLTTSSHETSLCSGHCCEHHETVLLQLLARLNWHLLDPSALDKLESLAFLQPTALLGIYRAHQRCSHLALHGSFNHLTLAGQDKGLRCYTAGGEQVLDCQSPCHLTAIANLSFTSGKHCWQFVVTVPCDLVWLGVGTDSLAPDIWGGKQSGGWFYGSNDALCHNRHSDRRAYEQHCGFGKWGDGTVVDVYLDMDARELWFSIDGAEAKLGFSGLPGRVYPAVSLRAPAQLIVRFRAASWLMAQQQQA